MRTGHVKTKSRKVGRLLGVLTAALLLTLSSQAQAASPSHARTPSLDITGLNHPCGIATDSKGDLYASSAGESKIKIYNPAHAEIGFVSNSNTPCGLAVDTNGNLYVSEQATGEVVRFKPLAYPFLGTPSYESREVIDASGQAKGIAVDPYDSRLYVAEGAKVALYGAGGSFEANLGEGTLTEATGVAAYTYPFNNGETSGTERYLWVADARGIEADRLYLFGGGEAKALTLRRQLSGSTTPNGSFGFGASGAYLAEDPGNRNTAGECKVTGEQACTAGHLLLYDAGHEALEEFDAGGEYLDQTKSAALADASPTAIAIERSGTASDGTIYVTAGAGAGAKALAFGPLKQPSRKALKQPTEESGGLSHTLKGARAVAVDSHGYVYVEAESFIHVYAPNGAEIKTPASKPLLEEPHNPFDLAVDSAGDVYVLDENAGTVSSEFEVTYYTPSKYPPDSTTTYTRHEKPIATPAGFPPSSSIMTGIAVNPGPSSGEDRLFVNSNAVTHEYDSVANGSELLNAEFGKCAKGIREEIAVNGSTGTAYISGNPHMVYAVNAADECVGRFENSGPESKKVGFDPTVAVDQADGHVVEYDETHVMREYDAAGAFVAEFGTFTEETNKPYRVAIDSACAIQGLTGKACEEFDPANGTVYLAYADPSATHPPFKGVNAFGALGYPGAAVEHKVTVSKVGSGSGTVTSNPAGIECGPTCSAQFEETEVVTLTASAAPNSEFVKWSGCESEPSPTECRISPLEDKSVTVEFESTATTEFPLTVSLEGAGSGEVKSNPTGIDCPATCTAGFGELAEVTLSAKAEAGSEFISWSGCDSEPEPEPGDVRCMVSMSEAREVKADFGAEHPLLSMLKEGDGKGTVQSEDEAIECGATCSAQFDLGDEVLLEARAEPGSEFGGWGEGDCEAETASPTEGTCTVTMSEARQVRVTFTALPQAIVEAPLPIGYSEATLRGEIDPAGLVAKYHFEYLTQAEYEANGETFAGAKHTPLEELAPASGFVAVGATLSALEEGTAYRFRLSVSAGPLPLEAEAEGAFATLQRRPAQTCPNDTYRFGLSANLPDCRAYELVTPAQTGGLTPIAENDGNTPSGTFSNWLTPQRGEAAGERLSYFTQGTLPGFEGNGLRDGYRATRGAGQHPEGGWQSALVSPDYLQSAPGTFRFALQHGVASDQLYSVWESNPEPETFPETLPQGVYLRTPAGFEPIGQGSLGSDLEALSRYVGPGGAHAIFSSKEHLEPDAPPAGNVALYDRAAGSASAHVLTLPPNGASAEEEAEFSAALRSKEQASFSGASEDGASAIFKAGVGLYVRLSDVKTEKLSPDTAMVGDTLSCAAGPLREGQTELGQRSFQWLRDAAPISGASGSDITNSTDYAAKPADAGAALQCLTVATFDDPRSVAVSAPVWIAPLEASQAPQPPAQIAAPTPADPTVGTTETCNPGSWTGAGSLSYQWYRNGTAIIGATAQTYEVQAADVPGTLQCLVSGTNADATVARASGLTPTSPAPAEAAPVATAQAAVKTTYAGVSEDGHYVFFALGNGKSPARLFRFDTQSESATEIAAAGIFALVSPDGSHVFFSSTEALSGSEENDNGEEAEAGKRNLYAWDGAVIRFVGRLSAQDFELEAFAGTVGMNLGAWTQAVGFSTPSVGRAKAPTRSTPGGGAFVFQSHAQLTSYDNEGVGEIYRYDPSAPVGERLLCVSCDPSGSPPSANALLEDIRTGVHGALNGTGSTMIANLSDDGKRVFFQSFDRLVPEDANEVEDVYEWQADGVGSCTRPSGCLALISSGQGETPSVLFAMSADGRDVFIQTKEKLVGADVPGSASIYDAREGGGIPEPFVPSPCQGDDCQGNGTLPPGIPGAATTGAGESGAPPPASRCAKGKHRVKGRCVATKKHKHRKHRRQRRAHANRGGKR